MAIATEGFVNSPNQPRKFTEKFFSELLSSAVKDIILLFSGKTYLHIDGVGMENLLGPTFANLFLCFHENNWLQNCPFQFKPKLYRMYVDDTFLLSDPSHIP